MAKHPRTHPQSPASRPGAAAPKLEPEPAPAAVVDATAAAAPEPASAASDAEEPTTPAPEAEPEPEPDCKPEPPAALRCRVNWHFAGFRERELHEGDEVDTDEAEAAPYLGGVLTRLEAAE